MIKESSESAVMCNPITHPPSVMPNHTATPMIGTKTMATMIPVTKHTETINSVLVMKGPSKRSACLWRGVSY